MTAFNANDTAGFAEDNVATGSRVVVTTLNGEHGVNTAGDNRICLCDVFSATDNVTFANDCEVRSVVNVDNLNNAVRFPVSSQCLATEVECNDSTLDINGSSKVDVSCKNYVEAVCEKVYKVFFVINGKSICCVNKYLFGQASANGNEVKLVAVSPVFNLGCVTGCRDFISISIAACAGVSGVTCFGAGGSSNSCLIRVTESLNFVCNVIVATNGASVGGVACFGAVRSSYNCFIRVTEGLNFVCNVIVATNGASVGGVACFGAGGSSNNCLIRVTESLNFVCNVIVAASASVGGVTCFGAGGSSYNCVVVVYVVRLGNNAVFDVTARSANSVLGAFFVFGSFLIGDPFTPCVTKSVNCFLSNENFVTYGAVLTFGKTGFFASGSLCFVNYFGVTESFCESFAAYGTDLSGSTGCCITCGMTESVNCFLSNDNLVTYGAVLTFGKTGFGAVGSFCCVNYFGVTESVNGDGFSGKFFFANCAVNYVIIAAVVYTIGCLFVFYNDFACGVTESVNGDGFSGDFCVTYRAVNYVVIAAVVYTISCLFVFYNGFACGVTESLNKGLATYGTGLSGFAGCCVAGGVLNFASFVTNVAVCIAIICVNVFTALAGDVELDGVYHCSYTAGNGGKGNGLSNGGVNSDDIICAIIGVLCKGICCSVNGNLSGVSLVFCNVNNNRGYVVRNGEGESTNYGTGSQLNARVAFSIDRGGIHFVSTGNGQCVTINGFFVGCLCSGTILVCCGTVCTQIKDDGFIFVCYECTAAVSAEAMVVVVTESIEGFGDSVQFTYGTNLGDVAAFGTGCFLAVCYFIVVRTSNNFIKPTVLHLCGFTVIGTDLTPNSDFITDTGSGFHCIITSAAVIRIDAVDVELVAFSVLNIYVAVLGINDLYDNTGYIVFAGGVGFCCMCKTKLVCFCERQPFVCLGSNNCATSVALVVAVFVSVAESGNCFLCNGLIIAS